MATNKVSIDFSGFSDYAEQIEKLGGSLKEVFTEALEKAAETIQADTLAALDNGNLPAGGKYSKGDTADSVIDDLEVTWSGSLGEISVGFDKTKPGAGGWLITGTPKMSPDKALNQIYKSQSYMNKRKKEMEEVFIEAVNRLMG